MKNRFSAHPHLWRTMLFLAVMAAVLGALSDLSMALDRCKNPLYNYSASGIFYEPDNSIDVLAIGTSDIYSGIMPLEWWNSYGYAGYAWGEPAQRVSETVNYLNRIYRRQSPRVVLLEVGNLFRDTTDAQNLDCMVKAQIARVFPVVTFHRNLAPSKFANWGAQKHSVTKGYLLRRGTVQTGDVEEYMKPDSAASPINFLNRIELRKCIEICRSHGSQVVLLAMPDFAGWDSKKHNAVSELAEQNDVTFLDLNEDMKTQINWNRDSADGGSHLNYKGAVKATAYLGEYLSENFTLPDRRSDSAYQQWDRDYADFAKLLESLKA
jgi:hypothetical protein